MVTQCSSSVLQEFTRPLSSITFQIRAFDLDGTENEPG